MSDYEKVGRVWIDGGYVVVADPWNFPTDGEWYDRLERLGNQNGEVHPGIVAVKTGLGDGIYEVEVRYEEMPGWGKRVAEMRIVFLTDEMKEIGEALLDSNSTTR